MGVVAATITRVSSPANHPAQSKPVPPTSGLGVDLHSHSLISDGILSPELLVQRAGEAGVRVLALTDHDTVGGIARARAAAPEGLEVLPGIEISAQHAGPGAEVQSVHVLGYFPPAQLAVWDVFAASRRESRLDRFDQMLDRLDALGVGVDRARVHAERAENPKRVPGRPHLARALITAGHVETMNEAFDRFLGNGGPAYVREQGPSVAEAIKQIHAAKGLAVVAHPIYGDLDTELSAFRDAGLDGIEALHFSHDTEQRAHYRALARDLGLLVTGGSDFHGLAEDPEGEQAHERLGHVDLDADTFAAFAERLGWAPLKAILG